MSTRDSRSTISLYVLRAPSARAHIPIHFIWNWFEKTFCHDNFTCRHFCLFIFTNGYGIERRNENDHKNINISNKGFVYMSHVAICWHIYGIAEVHNTRVDASAYFCLYSILSSIWRFLIIIIENCFTNGLRIWMWLNKMLRGYTCKRKTNRWPMVMWYNMLDVAAFAAFRLYQSCHPTWNTNKSENRKLFLKQLATELAQKHLQNRCKNPLKSSVKTAMDLIGFKVVAAATSERSMPTIQVKKWSSHLNLICTYKINCSFYFI